MKLEDQVCSLELAKRLKELGVKQESLVFWQFLEPWGKHPSEWQLRHYPNLEKSSSNSEHEISAFTVAELGEMLPRVFKNDDDMYYIEPNANGNGLRYMDYVKYHMGVGTFLRAYPLVVADTEADARAKMLIYLLENKLITL